MSVNILTVNLALSTVIFVMIARIYLLPRLPRLSLESVLLPILLLHTFRHLGLMFLAENATAPTMPPQFAYPAAIGDFVAAVLAVVAIVAVLKKSRLTKPLVWIFNIVGTADFVMAIGLAISFHATAHMGAAYWIPAFWVPGLIVGHWIVFILLVKHWKLSPRQTYDSSMY